MERLVGELREEVTEAAHLNHRIEKALEGLGYVL